MKKLRGILLVIFLVAIILAALNNKESPPDRSVGYSANVSVGKTAKQPTVKPSVTLRPANSQAPRPANSPTPAPTKKPENKVSIIAAPISGVSVSGSSSSVINKPSVKANGTPAAASTPFMTPAPTRRPSQTITPKPAVNNRAFPSVTAASTPIPGTHYVLNRHTHVFHRPSCNDVKRIKDSNRVDYTGTRQQVINMDYQPCKHCHP